MSSASYWCIGVWMPETCARSALQRRDSWRSPLQDMRRLRPLLAVTVPQKPGE